jgi:hypothetical protein
VTLSEVRRHLGVETQRQWSDLAILRTTPALLGLFSLVTLWADRLAADRGLRPDSARWYRKAEPALCDALALVRRELPTAPTFAMLRQPGTTMKSQPSSWIGLFASPADRPKRAKTS